MPDVQLSTARRDGATIRLVLLIDGKMTPLQLKPNVAVALCHELTRALAEERSNGNPRKQSG